MRRWVREWVPVGRPVVAAATPQPELPLPRDAHLMSATSQGLLAAARAGSTSAADREDSAAGKAPGAASSKPQPLFLVRRWVRLPRDREPPEPVYLAKAPAVPGGRPGDAAGGAGRTGASGSRPGPGLGAGDLALRPRRPPPPPKKKHKRAGRRPGFRKHVTFAAEAPPVGAGGAPAVIAATTATTATTSTTSTTATATSSSSSSSSVTAITTVTPTTTVTLTTESKDVEMVDADAPEMATEATVAAVVETVVVATAMDVTETAAAEPEGAVATEDSMTQAKGKGKEREDDGE